jgi:hypothetical protein
MIKERGEKGGFYAVEYSHRHTMANAVQPAR